MALYLNGLKKDAVRVWKSIEKPNSKEEKNYYKRIKKFFKDKQ